MPRRLLEGLLLALLLGGCGGSATPKAAAPEPTERHFSPAVATATPAPARPVGRYLTAALTRHTRLYEKPGGRVLTKIGAQTEFGSQSILGVVGRRGPWLKVVVSQLPNSHPGWIRARGTFLHGTDIQIVVDRSSHTAALRDDGRTVLRFPVAVGRPGNETPLGRYAVTDKLKPTDGTSPYGCCALALTGHQTQLEPGWPGGDRLAIHGTPATWSIGQAVSLGCMRAPAKALKKLMRRVPLGAPVVVRA